LQRRSPAAACGRSPRTWENFHCGSWEGRGSGRPEDEEEEVGDGDGAMELEFVPRRRLPAAPLIVAAYRIMYREWISCTVSTTAVLWFLSIRSHSPAVIVICCWFLRFFFPNLAPQHVICGKLVHATSPSHA